jgi:hypothetical protein
MKFSFFSCVLLSCAVFSSLTLPLAIIGSQPIHLKLQRENVFSGTVRDLAVPYLGIAGFLSLGVGVVSLSVTGWKNSHQKVNQLEVQLSAIQQELKDKINQLENLQLSEAYLKKSGLDQFLESPTAVAQEMVLQFNQVEPLPYPTLIKDNSQLACEPAASTEFTQFAELQTQINQMAEQLEILQSAFRGRAISVVRSAPVITPETMADSSTLMLEYLHRRLEQLESHWIREQAAS